MAEDIVVQLKELAVCTSRFDGRSIIIGAINEIDFLRSEVSRLSLEVKVQKIISF